MLPIFPALLFDIEDSLTSMTSEFGILVYLIVFFIILIESGIVIAPITGNSLLFLGGALAAEGDIHLSGFIVVIISASYIGYSINYRIGKYMGINIFQKRFGYMFTDDKVKRTRGFLKKYGPATIMIARFIPMVRKFAPFLAGTWSMNSRQFTVFNLLGAIIWTVVLVLFGYFAGHLTLIRENLPLITAIIILITLASILITIIIVANGLMRKEEEHIQ